MTNKILNPKEFPYSTLSRKIIGCCLEVINELGSGFLESVYNNALYFTLKQNGLHVSKEKTFEILFRGNIIGKYHADLVVEDLIIVELKAVRALIPEFQAQLINYLKASNMPIGLLVNFGNRKLEYKRLHHPNHSSKNDQETLSSFMLS
jgi:GxxExxY protein